MVKPLEDITQKALQLPKQQRLVLARLLLDLDKPSDGSEVEEAWDKEIRARIKAYDEGKIKGVPYSEVKKKMNDQFFS